MVSTWCQYIYGDDLQYHTHLIALYVRMINNRRHSPEAAINSYFDTTKCALATNGFDN